MLAEISISAVITLYSLSLVGSLSKVSANLFNLPEKLSPSDVDPVIGTDTEVFDTNNPSSTLNVSPVKEIFAHFVLPEV